MIKSDRWIKSMALERGMISPFEESQVGSGVISYGVSSYGYDMRLAGDFKIFAPESTKVLDPKKSENDSFVEIKSSDFVVIPPNSFCLARSCEYFKIPRDILCITFGKSTYARCGVLVNVTPLEPEWEGHITISISNTSPRPAKIYSNEGIAQVIFLSALTVCEKSYADKKGKYQAQQNITLAKILK